MEFDIFRSLYFKATFEKLIDPGIGWIAQNVKKWIFYTFRINQLFDNFSFLDPIRNLKNVKSGFLEKARDDLNQLSESMMGIKGYFFMNPPQSGNFI